MMAGGEAEGEVIQLIWEGWPTAFFVKGHIPPTEALTALEAEAELIKISAGPLLGERNWVRANLSPAAHVYARWSTEPGPDGACLTLRHYLEPGRGRFKVTMFDVLKWEKSEHDPWGKKAQP